MLVPSAAVSLTLSSSLFWRKEYWRSLSILRSTRVWQERSRLINQWRHNCRYMYPCVCMHVSGQVKSLHQHHFTSENVVLLWLAKTRSDGEMPRDRKWSKWRREQRGAFVRTAFRSMTVIPHFKNILFFLTLFIQDFEIICSTLHILFGNMTCTCSECKKYIYFDVFNYQNHEWLTCTFINRWRLISWLWIRFIRQRLDSEPSCWLVNSGSKLYTISMTDCCKTERSLFCRCDFILWKYLASLQHISINQA